MRLAIAILFALSLSAAETLPIRINCGDGQTTNLDDNGQVITFFQDRNFTGGTEYREAGTAGTDAGVQHTARYGPQFSYSFSVPNGSYTVRTWHRDPSATAAGQRLMSISVNGAQAISLDIYKSVGLGIFKQSFPVSITTGNIALSFSGTPGTPLPNAMLNAIEILPVGVPTPVVPPPIVTPPITVTSVTGPMGPPGPPGPIGPPGTTGSPGAPGGTDPVALAAAVASYLKANPIPAVDSALIAGAVTTYMRTNPVQASGDPLAPLVAITRPSPQVLQVTYRGKSCSLTLDPLSRDGARIALGDSTPLVVVGALITSSDPTLCSVVQDNRNRYVSVADWGSSANGWDDPANPAANAKVYSLPEILRIVAGGVCVCPGK